MILERIGSAAKTSRLLRRYLDRFRADSAPPDLDPLAPFTEDAIDAVFARSDGKPRDILRKAQALIERGAEENWAVIDGEKAAQLLDTWALDEADEDLLNPSAALVPGDIDWGGR